MVPVKIIETRMGNPAYGVSKKSLLIKLENTDITVETRGIEVGIYCIPRGSLDNEAIETTEIPKDLFQQIIEFVEKRSKLDQRCDEIDKILGKESGISVEYFKERWDEVPKD